ncbi:MAG: TetR/AcrR family transcriptional regulator [Bermanella sp.]
MAYKPTANTEARKAQTRQNLLNQGLTLVNEGGFKSVTISSVAKRADVATGTVYRHFTSKSHLCTEIFQLGTEREVGKVREALAQQGDVATLLENATRVFMQRAIKGRQLAYAMIAESVDTELDEERKRYREVWAHTYEPILQRGVNEGVLPKQNVAISAAAMVGAMAEVLVGPLSPSTHHLEVNELIDAMVDFCKRSVGAQ